VGHHDVEQHEIGVFAANQGQGLTGIGGADEVSVSAGFQLTLKYPKINRLVVDEQKFSLREPRRGSRFP
jgi:hypothetical protein